MNRHSPVIDPARGRETACHRRVGRHESKRDGRTRRRRIQRARTGDSGEVGERVPGQAKAGPARPRKTTSGSECDRDPLTGDRHVQRATLLPTRPWSGHCGVPLGGANDVPRLNILPIDPGTGSQGVGCGRALRRETKGHIDRGLHFDPGEEAPPTAGGRSAWVLEHETRFELESASRARPAPTRHLSVLAASRRLPPRVGSLGRRGASDAVSVGVS